MAGPYFYFQVEGQSTVYPIDTNAIQVSLPPLSRAYSAKNLFSDGAVIVGTGSMIPGEIQFTKKNKKTGSYTTAWNSLRYLTMQWLGVAKTSVLYFYILDANGTLMRQRVWPISRSSESYSSIALSDEITFSFQMEKAYFYNVSTSTTTYTVTSSQMEIFTVTNNGMLPVAPLIQFVPTGACISLQVQLAAGNYGFTLVGSWAAGTILTFDCATGTVTVNGAIATGLQSAGSIFQLIPGANVLYITAVAGAAQVSFNERYF